MNDIIHRVFWMTCAECAMTQLHQPCEACPNGAAQLK